MCKKSTSINKNNERVRNARNSKYQFTMIDNDLLLRIGQDCGGNAFALYMTLLSYLNHKTGICCPSMTTLEEKTKMSRNTVNTSLKKLKTAGFIDWEQDKGINSKWNQNYYYFLYPSDNTITDVEEDVEEDIEEVKEPEPIIEETEEKQIEEVKVEKTTNKAPEKQLVDNIVKAINNAKKVLNKKNKDMNRTNAESALENVKTHINNYKSNNELSSLVYALLSLAECKIFGNLTETEVNVEGIEDLDVYLDYPKEIKFYENILK